MYAVATWLLTADRTLRVLALLTGAAVFVAGVWAGAGEGSGRSPPVFLASIAYQMVMIWVLGRYTFGARQVMTETILAATALYLVIVCPHLRAAARSAARETHHGSGRSGLRRTTGTPTRSSGETRSA